MAIVLVQETQWHGNPRPIESWNSCVYDDAVSPIQYRYFTTPAPIASYTPAAAIDVAGPDLVVSGSVDGLWPIGSGLSIAITVDGGTNISTTIGNGSQLFSAEQWASEVAKALNTIGAGDVQCGATGKTVTISALAGVTNLTITTWAVA